MKFLLAVLLLAASAARAATWETFVNGALAAPAPAPLLTQLHVEPLNAAAFSSVMRDAGISLEAVQGLPADRQAPEVQRQVGLYARGLLAMMPEQQDEFKTLSPAFVREQFLRFDALRHSLGAVPEAIREDVMHSQSDLWSEASRRGMSRLLKEPEEWKKNELVYHGDGASPSVTVDGREYARTGRGIAELLGAKLTGAAASYPRELLDIARLRGKKVLDIASGSGTLVTDLRSQGIDAVGVDPYLNARQRANPQAFRQGGVEKLPFPDGSFDVIYSNWGPFVYDHTDDVKYAAYLKEVARVLRPGGRVVITPFLPEDLESLLEEVGGLELSPDMTFRRQRGEHYLNRAITWKGKPWSGDAFIELIKKPL
jgi:SAM-dependent methyltransferase